jgi:hypothetical protein
MYTQDPVSLLPLHHADHSRLVADAARASARPASSLRSRASNAYYAAVRRAYVRARAARTQSMHATTSRVTL